MIALSTAWSVIDTETHPEHRLHFGCGGDRRPGPAWQTASPWSKLKPIGHGAGPRHALGFPVITSRRLIISGFLEPGNRLGGILDEAPN